MSGSLEHVNVTVENPDVTAALMCTLFDWHVRWEGNSMHDGRTVHVGTSDQYVAVYSMPKSKPSGQQSYEQIGALNHVGIHVTDLDATEQRVVAAGYTTFNHADYEPGRRFYFRDENSIEFEILSYAGDEK